LLLNVRQDFNDASKEYIARHQQEVEHQDSRKQATEDCARSSEQRA